MNEQTKIQQPETSQRPHKDILDWQTGPLVDRTIAAMMNSSKSKKPGRVLERIAKHAGKIFSDARIIRWEKGEKIVYLQTLSISPVNEVSKNPTTEAAILLNSLYLMANDDYTKIDLKVSGALSLDLAKTIYLHKSSDSSQEAILSSALSKIRLITRGVVLAQLPTNTTYDLLIPLDDIILKAKTLLFEGDENGQQMSYPVVYAYEIVTRSSLCELDIDRIKDIPAALQAETYPGDEIFSTLIHKNAIPHLNQ